jgi:hypothetical protein
MGMADVTSAPDTQEDRCEDEAVHGVWSKVAKRKALGETGDNHDQPDDEEAQRTRLQNLSVF